MFHLQYRQPTHMVSEMKSAIACYALGKCGEVGEVKMVTELSGRCVQSGIFLWLDGLPGGYHVAMTQLNWF